MTKFFIDQHGCAKNQVDGELIINHLEQLGLQQVFSAEEADLIIVNSCGFIESAKKEALDAVYYARESFPNAKILLTGCLAERYADVLNESLPEADGIFGNGNLDKIDEVVLPLLKGQRKVVKYSQEGVCCGERSTFLSFRGTAFVKITEGCNNRCTFCAIPVIRGELRSRPASEIISEIKKLVANGIYEINLIGQDLAAYGTGEKDDVFGEGKDVLPLLSEDGTNHGTEKASALSRLLSMISEIEGNFIVRPLYMHPDHFNRDILPVMQNDSRILPYFDIPFQSGDDTLIRKMNRRGSQKEYIRLICDIRKALPQAVIRTTFLTGFPGETDEMAQNSVEFLKNIKSDWSGCFTYSREEDTPAYSYKNRVSGKIASQRAENLRQIQSVITKESLLRHVGKEYDVLIEEVVEGEDGLAIGRAWFQAPEVDGSVVVRYEKDFDSENCAVKTGNVVKVRIDSASDVDLSGTFTGLSEKSPNGGKTDYKFAPEIQNA